MYYLFFRKLIYKQHGISLFAHLWIFELSRLFSLRYHVRIWGLFFVPLFFFKKNSLYLVITSLICSAVIYLNIFFYESNFSCDSGVFVMKFIELWSPRILLSNLLSNENICNIRVQYANRIFFHEKNQMLQTEIQNVVLNWFDSVSISTIFFSFVLFIFFS